MPDITPSFTFEFERRMRAITEQEYARRMRDAWWNKVCRTVNLEGKTERLAWILSTALIDPVGPSGVGDIAYESMVTQTTELASFRHAKGLRVGRDEIEDLEGTGLDFLSKWASDIGQETAYVPQRLAAQALLNGANTDGSANAYDGVAYFSDNSTNSLGVKGHPYNPYRLSLGAYANWLHGSASGTYPGALPIDDSVTTDVALQNLGKAIAYIASVKMPNGVDPRKLKPSFLIVPPRMAPRVRQLTEAKFIAQAANSGGGAADVMALITGWGLGTPIVADEIQAAITYNFKMPFVSSGTPTFLAESATGSDTTYYIVCEENMTTSLGGLLYCSRKPFKVNYYTGDSAGSIQQAELDRKNEFEYHVQGRVSVQYGHPYCIFRVDAS